MTDRLTPDPDRHGNNDISTEDFSQQARQAGWPFWRGVLIGFASAFVIGYLALSSSPFLFAG